MAEKSRAPNSHRAAAWVKHFEKRRDNQLIQNKRKAAEEAARLAAAAPGACEECAKPAKA